MKVLSRLKRSARITSYIQPKKIVITRNQADIAQRLGLTIEAYAKAYFDNFCAYKKRYC